MAKKKKKSGQRDARGYATSNAKPKPKSNVSASAQGKGGNVIVDASKLAGKSVRKIQVSQSAQDQIASLLDELKQSLEGDEAGLFRPGQPIDFSVDDKKMIKKVATIVSVNVCVCGVCMHQALSRNTGTSCCIHGFLNKTMVHGA